MQKKKKHFNAFKLLYKLAVLTKYYIHMGKYNT